MADADDLIADMENVVKQRLLFLPPSGHPARNDPKHPNTQNRKSKNS